MLMIATVLPRKNREDDFGVTLPVILGGPAGRVRVGDDMDLGLQIRNSGWNSAQFACAAMLAVPRETVRQRMPAVASRFVRFNTGFFIEVSLFLAFQIALGCPLTPRGSLRNCEPAGLCPVSCQMRTRASLELQVF